jgi:elongin-A
MANPPSLVDLCIRSAIDNIQYIGDVGETDFGLLKVILAHCTSDQLLFIENSTEGRDLSPVTDDLWQNFYARRFGEESADLVRKRMKLKKVSFKWSLLFQAKAKEQEEQQQKSVERSLNRLKQLYAQADSEKQSRQIQICSTIPPGGKKRKFTYGGSSSDFSNVKGRLMKKAKMEFVASCDARRNATVNKNSLQGRSVIPLGRLSSACTTPVKSSSTMASSHIRHMSSNVSTASVKNFSTMTSGYRENSNVAAKGATVKNFSTMTSGYRENSNVAAKGATVKNLSTMTSNCPLKSNVPAKGASVKSVSGMTLGHLINSKVAAKGSSVKSISGMTSSHPINSKVTAKGASVKSISTMASAHPVNSNVPAKGASVKSISTMSSTHPVNSNVKGKSKIPLQQQPKRMSL